MNRTYVMHCEMINEYKILAGKPETKRPLGKSPVDRRIILKWMLQKQYVTGCGLASTDLEYDPMAIPCKLSNKSLGFIWGGEFIQQLSPQEGL